MKGFALLEVLVALFILSFGLLGIAGMQLTALQQSQNAYWQSLATVQLFSMLERLHVNQSLPARNNEFAQWNIDNARLLPHGKGNYQCQTNACAISLHWLTNKAYVVLLSAYL